MNQNYEPGAPPPTYQQQGTRPGQTYYEPPPPPQPMSNPSQPPQQQHHQPLGNVRGRIVKFYSPPQNNRLGLRRRFFSICCCFILVGLIVGLVAGLVTRSQHSAYGYSSTSCRTNSDCYYRYGSGTYCYYGSCSR